MTIVERFATREDARRAWRRVPTRLPMRCRRLGRIEADIAVDTVDVSLGGVRLRCGGLITGDVVLCLLDGPRGGLELNGLVVQSRMGPGGPPFVHISWTGLAPADVGDLGLLLDVSEAAERRNPAP